VPGAKYGMESEEMNVTPLWRSDKGLVAVVTARTLSEQACSMSLRLDHCPKCASGLGAGVQLLGTLTESETAKKNGVDNPYLIDIA